MAQTKNFKENNFVVRNEVVEMLRVEVNRFKPLAHDELINLISEAQNGSQAARNKVINANLRLVWSIAASYGTMMEFADMFQNGTIGLCLAVDSFDVSRETMFSTWALEQVRKYINIGLDTQSRTVRMGVHEIRAKKTNIAASMDAPLASDEDGEKTLLDTFASDMKCDTFSEVHDMRVKLNYLFSALKPIEREVVCGLFGLTDSMETEYTLSKKFNLTEERIRQIKWEALEKMKKIA
jgi:RNA polymerase sigma factor (sigma-70 family)